MCVCVLSGGDLRDGSRGVLPSVMFVSVIEEPHRGGLASLEVNNNNNIY